MNEFEKLGLDKETLEVLESLEFTTPTEIQEKTIPAILKGRDLTGIAQTGSGKTLAFATGIMHTTKPREGVQALVLTPTRELTEQISKVIQTLTKNMNLVVQEVFGGVNIERQILGIKHAEIIVGTPGRILDHLHRNTLNLKGVKMLVLDEADRMAGMGFLPDVEKIISQTPKTRQTLLYSATTSQDVNYIEQNHMKNPLQVSVTKYVDASKLHQKYFDVEKHQKFSLLAHLLKNEKSGIALVFCNTRRNVDLISKNLSRHNIKNQAIHGGLEQKKRSRIIEELHNKNVHILICTDVAARGLDIKDVTHVYNYDMPKTSEEYVHRVGRTARAGEKGLAISLVSSNDYDNFARVLEDHSIKIVREEMPQIQSLSAKFRDERSDRRGGRGRPYQRDHRVGRRDRPRNKHSERDDFRTKKHKKSVHKKINKNVKHARPRR